MKRTLFLERMVFTLCRFHCIDRINKKPIRKQYKRVETIMSSATKSIPVYYVEVRDSDHEFKFRTETEKP